jgi:hypothetical protein
MALFKPTAARNSNPIYLQICDVSFVFSPWIVSHFTRRFEAEDRTSANLMHTNASGIVLVPTHRVSKRHGIRTFLYAQVGS